MKLSGSGKEKREENKTGFAGAAQTPSHKVKHKITRQNTCYLRISTVARNDSLLGQPAHLEGNYPTEKKNNIDNLERAF